MPPALHTRVQAAVVLSMLHCIPCCMAVGRQAGPRPQRARTFGLALLCLLEQQAHRPRILAQRTIATPCLRAPTAAEQRPRSAVRDCAAANSMHARTQAASTTVDCGCTAVAVAAHLRVAEALLRPRRIAAGERDIAVGLRAGKRTAAAQFPSHVSSVRIGPCLCWRMHCKHRCARRGARAPAGAAAAATAPAARSRTTPCWGPAAADRQQQQFAAGTDAARHTYRHADNVRVTRTQPCLRSGKQAAAVGERAKR